jgi:ATP-dependent DNA helicase RecG
MSFVPLMRTARAWLDAPCETKLDELIAQGKDASEKVPEERRGDWERLLSSLARHDDEARTRAFVESLGRACRTFARPRRSKASPPAALSPLDPVDRLPGLGPSSRVALAEHGVRHVLDLLWTPPVAWDDLRAPMPLGEAIQAARALAEAGADSRPPRVVVRARVKAASIVPIRGRRCVRVVLEDESAPRETAHAFWFFMAHGPLAVAKPGSSVLCAGRFRAAKGKPPRAAHPELFADVPEARIVRARYARLGPKEGIVRKAIAHALAEGVIADPVPAAIAEREGLPCAERVVREVHGATGEPPSGEAQRAFVERLAWSEAFTRVWERLGTSHGEGMTAAPVLAPREDLTRALERELGFAFTGDQREAIAEVSRDLALPRPMRRLLLGDVGTGKTAVALAAVAQCTASGFSAAILAPTSVLAEQYLDAVRPLARAASVEIAFVAAGMPAAARAASEEALRSGRAKVAIGTHALLRDAVAIPDLALVVVDEQQRLGVAQRLSLVAKGKRPHLLTLSATPIPRTLALALRGELATSTLRERPAGRPPVATELATRSELPSVVARVARACADGERVFWVVPRITADEDEDEDVALASVTARAATLRDALGGSRVVLLHGGMPPAEMREAMRAFRRGEAHVLVGTTVVEVGVDVPEATLMVVEDAERFGLAQLHQLRGRVGRGARPAACVLLHGEPLEGFSRRRLVALTEMHAGEDIARADLELRGAGDLGGTRQHGAEEGLAWLSPGATYPWLARLEDDARAIHGADPALAAEEHRALAAMVARFRHAIAVREEAG